MKLLGGQTRGKEQREKDLAKVAELYLKGKLQHEIAEKLGVSQATISNDLKTLRKRWLDSSLRDFDAAKAEELAKLDQLLATYWTAWERSLENEITDKRTGPDAAGGGVVLERQQTIKSSSGNPAYLKGVQECIDKRAKILGLDAPEKKEISGPGGSKLIDAERMMTVAEIVMQDGDFEQ